MSEPLRRGAQIGLTFVADDPLHARLMAVAHQHGLRPTQVVRELIRDYLKEWVEDQRAHRRELRRRASGRRRR